MPSNYIPEKHHRRSIRLNGFDYGRSKMYFLTFNTHNRKRIFGYVKDGRMLHSAAGLHAIQCWEEIPVHHPYVILHAFIIMPDHVHGILEIVDNRDQNLGTTEETIDKMLPKTETNNNLMPEQIQEQRHYYTSTGKKIELSPNFHSPSKTIGSIIRGYKIGVTKWYRSKGIMTEIWQRNYYDQIIWDDRAYHNITQYIENNPKNYGRKLNPASKK